MPQDTKEKMPLSRTELRPVPHLADTFWATYMISVAAACVAEFATYPLDLTKTRLQVQGEAASVTGKKIVSLSATNFQLSARDDNRVNNSIKRTILFSIESKSKQKKHRKKTKKQI